MSRLRGHLCHLSLASAGPGARQRARCNPCLRTRVPVQTRSRILHATHLPSSTFEAVCYGMLPLACCLVVVDEELAYGISSTKMEFHPPRAFPQLVRLPVILSR
ncbi:hypothetical protein GQ53DRAFT_24241 [Thozetella sp. PMI_491]|nr:hypothetical protein GQ53DRAFT_24241 [Thozetella sp. PMI_491]